MAQHPRKSATTPLDRAALERLALRYVERYATTRYKLSSYLGRKLRERGWSDDQPPPIEQIVERFVEFGYVDDREFARMRAGSLTRRGYGERRIAVALKISGINDEDSSDAREMASAAALESAMTFARKKRLGPFAIGPVDRPAAQKAFAAMLRAGHPPDICRSVLNTEPADEGFFFDPVKEMD